MYIVVVLCPSFSAVVDLGVIPKAFIHHLQAGCSWTKFCIYYYDMEFLVVQSPSWLDANWNLGLSPETALRGTWNDEGQRIIFWSDILCSHHFLISTHHELSRGILFSENGAIEGWDIMSFESPFISKDVEMEHKSTRMYIGFTVSPKVCQVTSTDAPLKFS